MPNFLKTRPVGAELFHADGRTDMMKLIVAFRNFANAPKSGSTHLYGRNTSEHPGEGQIFLHQKSRPTLGPAKPPIQHALGPFLREQSGRSVRLTIHFYLVLNIRMSGSGSYFVSSWHVQGQLYSFPFYLFWETVPSCVCVCVCVCVRARARARTC
jgi:hypothetical protein